MRKGVAREGLLWPKPREYRRARGAAGRSIGRRPARMPYSDWRPRFSTAKRI
jgi:hypothetical protein